MTSKRPPAVRTIEPNRSQVVIEWGVLEDMLPADHMARLLWELVSRLDLTPLLVGIKAVEGGAGRSPLSPRVKLTLWTYAVSQGIGSAREIARRLKTDLAYRWITGGQTVNHDTLSAFRATQGEALDQVLTNLLTTLLDAGALSLDVVAQDGLRVRASAGAPSFRRGESLEPLRQQAALHVKAVLAQGDDPSLSRRQKAASQAAAKALQQRIERAIQTLSQIQQSPDPPKTPRASTTDPEARVMKMPDGGFRPAYNVQLATAGSPEGGPRTIVGVRVTNVGSDMNAVKPMLEDIARRTGQTPKTLLADANHTAHAGLVAAAARGVEAIIAVPEPSKAPRSRHARQDEVTTDWRARMQTAEAKEQMRGRGGLAELSNAHMRRFGLDQFLVCGLNNVTTVVLLAAITFDLLQNAARLLSLT